jgi:syntaxin 7
MYVSYRKEGCELSDQASRKAIQTKTSRDFTTAITAFQRVQRLSAERQRSNVEVQKRRVDQMVEEAEGSGGVMEERGSVELERVQQQTQIQAQAPG